MRGRASGTPNGPDAVRTECPNTSGWEREVPITERHRRQDKRPRFRPDDPRQFGQELGARLRAAQPGLDQDLAGYDQRLLLKIVLRAGEALPDIDAIPGMELVSQEDRAVVLAFATTEGIAEVEARLSMLARDGAVTRAQLLYAIEDFSHWTPDDRTGNALRQDGFPEGRALHARRRAVAAGTGRSPRPDAGALCRLARCRGHRAPRHARAALVVMVRVRCSRQQAVERLLRHRDVRTLDLPPRFGVELSTLQTGIGEIPPPVLRAGDMPSVTVLDSGLTTGHPLVGAAGWGTHKDSFGRIAARMTWCPWAMARS